MKPRAIISKSQALQILMNDLRKAALEKRAPELEGASVEARQRISDEIERDIRREVQRRSGTLDHGDVLY